MRKAMAFIVLLLLGAPAISEDPVLKDLKRFTGIWKVQSMKVDGRDIPKADRSDNDLVVYDADGGWQQRGGRQILFQGIITAIATAARHKAIDYKIVKDGKEEGSARPTFLAKKAAVMPYAC